MVKTTVTCFNRLNSLASLFRTTVSGDSVMKRLRCDNFVDRDHFTKRMFC